jgi:hypothetical protein
MEQPKILNPTDKIKLDICGADITKILNALVNRPFAEVRELIETIEKQTNEQLK